MAQICKPLIAIGAALLSGATMVSQANAFMPSSRLCGGPVGKSAGESTQPSTAPAPETRAAQAVAELKLNPAIFFQRLVDRYRGLHLYKDVVNIVQVTQREGVESNRVETEIACEIADGELSVKTPASQARKQLGAELPLKQSQAMKDAQKKYDLWLAPHMTLKFTQEPLKEMRTGVDEGFTATEAEPVTIDNKKMVHVELRSGDGLSESCNARVDLYVNSDSMLIERIDTEQRLPDGANYSTTLHITPGEVEGEMPASDAPKPLPATDQIIGPAK